MIKADNSGSFKNTTQFLERLEKFDVLSRLDGYAREGVNALANATPKDSGLAASSWDYEIQHTKGQTKIFWTNSNIENGTNVIILLQYGHGTKGGGYVQGRDFINPVMRGLFDRIADDVWKAITQA